MRYAGCRGRLALALSAALLLGHAVRAQDGKEAKKAEEPKKDQKAREPKADPAFARQVNGAIDRAVKYLRGAQRPDGSWPYAHMGATALAGLALLESGTAPTDAAVKKAADWVRQRAVRENYGYSVTTAILFLDRLGDPRDEPFIQALAVRLLAAQLRPPEGGGWGYYTANPSAAEVQRLEAVLKARNDPMAVKAAPKGGKKTPLTPKDLPQEIRDQIAQIYNGPAPTGQIDLSNTQFAALALWVARRHGIPVEQAFASTDVRLRRTQFANGGWSYLHAPGSTDADFQATPQMTCAGLMILAMSHAVLDDPRRAKKDLAKDVAIRKALEAIKGVVGKPAGDMAKVPQLPAGQHTRSYYALWTLERAAVLFDLKMIDGKDWYRWGAEILLKNQRSDGSWAGAFPEGGADTCFSLLFLKRANLAADLTQKIRKDPGSLKLLEGIQTEGGKTKSDLVPPPKQPGKKQSRVAPAQGPALLGVRPGLTWEALPPGPRPQPPAWGLRFLLLAHGGPSSSSPRGQS